jgi:hypothetical protein
MKRPLATHALVRIPLAPVRAEPNVRAELVSQELLGSAVRILQRDGEWVRTAGADNYEGWINGGALLECSAEVAEAWWDELGARTALALDARLVTDDGNPLVRLPWGARVATLGEIIVLPDDRRGRLLEGELIAWEEIGTRFAATGAAVVETARLWSGVAYLWGGRTRWGVDCSGFAQAVYRLHGFQLPRDSWQQAEYGEPVPPGAAFENLRPGDLVFFTDEDAERIVHVAFSLGGPGIMHAALSNGAVQEDVLGQTPLGAQLSGRVDSVRRFFWD